MLDSFLEKEAFKNREVYIWGEIDDDLTLHVVQQLTFLGKASRRPIFLHIHTHGGKIDCQSIIMDHMQSLQNEKIIISTIVSGIAYSVGAVILACGSKGYRYARPGANIMLHPTSYHLKDDYMDNQQLVSDFLKKRQDVLDKRIATACGMKNKLSKFNKDISKGLWLLPEEAIQYGVVDAILYTNLPTVGGYAKTRN